MNITCIHTYYKSVNLINIKLLIAINVFETRVARLLPFEVALYGYKKHIVNPDQNQIRFEIRRTGSENWLKNRLNYSPVGISKINNAKIIME